MKGARQFVQARAVTHCKDEFGDDIAGVLADDGDAKDIVLPGHCQHLDHSARLGIRDGTIQMIDSVDSDLVHNVPVA